MIGGWGSGDREDRWGWQAGSSSGMGVCLGEFVRGGVSNLGSLGGFPFESWRWDGMDWFFSCGVGFCVSGRAWVGKIDLKSSIVCSYWILPRSGANLIA